MSPAPQEARTGFSGLPHDTLVSILALLDPTCLRSAITAGPVLYRPYQFSKSFLLGRIINPEIEPSLLHDAAAAQVSADARKHCWSEAKIKQFVAQYVKRGMRPRVTSVPEVSALIGLHRTVTKWVDCFFREAARCTPIGYAPRWELEISPSERFRAFKVLYRFEIYCNLFSTSTINFGVQEQGDLFLSHFMPWENEQLCCVYERLYKDYVGSLLRQLAKNNSVWISWHSDLGNADHIPEAAEWHVAQGLQWLEPFCDNRRNWVDWIDWICNAAGDFAGGPQAQGYLTSFLGASLEESRPVRDDEWVSSTDEDASQKKPVPEDPDDGPEAAWQWICRVGDMDLMNDFANPWNHGVRKWAYVFWDRSRLDRWGTLTMPIEEARRANISTDKYGDKYLQDHINQERKRRKLKKRYWRQYQTEAGKKMQAENARLGKYWAVP